MNVIQNYDLEKDEHVYISTKIHLSSEKVIYVDACTVAGSKDGITPKPNEDAFYISQTDKNTLYLCVLDGDSSVLPIPSLKGVSGARFSSHNLQTLLNEIVNSQLTAEQIVTRLNDKMRSKISSFPEINLKDPSTLPGSSITLIKMDFKNNRGELISIGDTLAIFYYKNNDSKLITDDLLKQYDDDAFCLIKQIAGELNISNKEARQDKRVQKQIVKRYKTKINCENKSGYGILNGQFEVREYIQKVIFNISELTGILMGTDGIVPLNLDPESIKDQKKLKEMVEKGGLREVIQRKQMLENNDPDYNDYIRYKHSDDATAIYLCF